MIAINAKIDVIIVADGLYISAFLFWINMLWSLYVMKLSCFKQFKLCRFVCQSYHSTTNNTFCSEFMLYVVSMNPVSHHNNQQNPNQPVNTYNMIPTQAQWNNPSDDTKETKSDDNNDSQCHHQQVQISNNMMDYNYSHYHRYNNLSFYNQSQPIPENMCIHCIDENNYNRPYLYNDNFFSHNQQQPQQTNVNNDNQNYHQLPQINNNNNMMMDYSNYASNNYNAPSYTQSQPIQGNMDIDNVINTTTESTININYNQPYINDNFDNQNYHQSQPQLPPQNLSNPMLGSPSYDITNLGQSSHSNTLGSTNNNTLHSLQSNNPFINDTTMAHDIPKIRTVLTNKQLLNLSPAPEKHDQSSSSITPLPSISQPQQNQNLIIPTIRNNIFNQQNESQSQIPPSMPSFASLTNVPLSGTMDAEEIMWNYAVRSLSRDECGVLWWQYVRDNLIDQTNNQCNIGNCQNKRFCDRSALKKHIFRTHSGQNGSVKYVMWRGLQSIR